MTFGSTSTADEVLTGVDLSGRTMIVTGASGGIGAETARALAARGATVVLAARDLAKAENAASAITEAVPAATIQVRLLDLSSLASVRSFTDTFLGEHERLDALIANAGVMATPFELTADGFELQFGTNHLGHFLMVNRLVPALVAAAPSRVVVLSSAGHRWSDVDLDDPFFDRTPYDKYVAYGRSKTANVLFAVELDRRLRAQGVRAFAVHPGAIHTELGRSLTDEDRRSIAEMAKRGGTTWKTVEHGAATAVWAATSPELQGRGGDYLEDCAVATPTVGDARHGVRPYALDPIRAEALWELSERLVGEKFPDHV
jgi:NAD(P)-dependent dehydrogenase (short-subunit alcohol dehydrogenase family)